MTWALWDVPAGGDLPDPPPSRGSLRLLTGRGLGLVWSPDQGPLRILTADGTGPPPGFRVDHGPVQAVTETSAGAGLARRRIHRGGAGSVVEEVVLRDAAPGVILRWTLMQDGSGGGRPGEGVDVVVHPGEGAECVRIPLTPGVPVARIYGPGGTDRIAGSASAQALRRTQRGNEDGDPLEVLAEGPEPARELGGKVAAAASALDDAPLGEDRDGRPRAPFILGVGDEGLMVAAGSAPAELGLGALAAGRFPLALSLLEALAPDPSAPEGLVLLLAAEWGLSTGELSPVLRLRSHLDACVARGVAPGAALPAGAPPPHGRAFPPLSHILERLAGVVEPVDPAWTGELRGAAAGLRRPPPSSSRSLPVLGSPAPAAELPEEWKEQFPPVEAFGHPDAPGLLARRTLHAARLLRSVSGGLLGIGPDAPYGRLRLAPALPPGWQRLEVRGIRVGDTRVDLDVARDDGGVRFRLDPREGRIPPTVIFEPTLSLGRVDRVTLQGDPVEVDILPDGGTTRIRFQFPLDGPREVWVEGD